MPGFVLGAGEMAVKKEDQVLAFAELSFSGAGDNKQGISWLTHLAVPGCLVNTLNGGCSIGFSCLTSWIRCRRKDGKENRYVQTQKLQVSLFYTPFNVTPS